MGPCKKFYSILPGESFEELRNRRGVSLQEYIEEINKIDKNKSSGTGPPKELTFENLSEDDREAQTKLKRLRGALNKLAPDNFYIQLIEIQDGLPVQSCHLMKIFVRELIQKVSSEPNYYFLYAHLCHALSPVELLEVPGDDDLILTFGDLVLDECYRYFSYNRSSWNWFYIHDPTPEELIALEAKEFRKRKVLVGLARFLGELYKAGMLDANGIYEYIKKLEQEINEKNIEGLCALLTVVGKDLEVDVFQSEHGSDWSSTWERVVNLSKREANLPLRQMFMLMDLLDLMNNGWVSKNPPALPSSHVEILFDFQNAHGDKVVKNLGSRRQNYPSKRLIQPLEDTVISNNPAITEMEQKFLDFLKSGYDMTGTIEVDNWTGQKTWFVYAVTRATLRASIDGNVLNVARLRRQIDQLKKYISSRQAEVASMYAVQYLVVVELGNPKGLLVDVTRALYDCGALTYIGLLDWRENWSGHQMLEVRGRSTAHISLASLFASLFRDSLRPNYKQIVHELNSFDLEHFVYSPKLPPEIAKRTKLEEERDKSELSKNIQPDADDDQGDLPLAPLTDKELLRSLKNMNM